MYGKSFQAGSPHGGVDYLEFIKQLATALRPRAYLEIGTYTGDSVLQVPCDALCIDPHFEISRNVLQRRRRSFFFQMPSDEFFRDHSVETFLPEGVDMIFLDGLHHFEATLRDFINVERAAHRRTVAMIHDCLPTSLDMATRPVKPLMWTGDVWRLLPIFKKYRPDLRVAAVDCEPTGLIVCTGLDPRSTVLADRYYDIVDEFFGDDLTLERLGEVGGLYPYLDSRKVLSEPADISGLFG
jgi:hypothetical protein